MNDNYEKNQFKITQNENKIGVLSKKITQNKNNIDSQLESLETQIETLEETTESQATQISELEGIIPNAIYNSYERFHMNLVMSSHHNTETRPIYFVNDKRARMKLKISFNVFSNFTSNKTVTVLLNGETIYSDIREMTSETVSHQLEYDTITGELSNNLIFKITDDGEQALSAIETSFRHIDIEVFGINVAFITRSNDFWAYPTDTSYCMSHGMNTASDLPYISIQTADASLDLNSGFNTFVTSTRRINNDIFPFTTNYVDAEGVVHFNTNPAAMVELSHETTFARIVNIHKNISSYTVITGYTQRTMTLERACFNSGSTLDGGYISITSTGKSVYFDDKRTSFTASLPSQIYAECSGALRISQWGSLVPVVVSATSYEGKTYLYVRDPAHSLYYNMDLGFGTRVNLYYVSNGIEVYMNRYNDVIKITLEISEETNRYVITNQETITGIQEYFRGLNGSYFIRKNKKILYYPNSSATTPTSTLDVWC